MAKRPAPIGAAEHQQLLDENDALRAVAELKHKLAWLRANPQGKCQLYDVEPGVRPQ